MDCQAIDVKAYGLGEGSGAERRDAEAHLKSCAECRGELSRLQFVQAALGGLREEEPPRRIAFVSDKVFEPTWWQRFWASGPRVGFAGAGLLSIAILVHGFVRPPAGVQQQASAVVAQVNQQDIDAAVAKAVAQVKTQLEQQQNAKISELLTATEKKYELDQKALAVAMDENTLLRKNLNNFMVQTAGLVKN